MYVYTGEAAEGACGLLLGPVLTVVVVRWATMVRPFEHIEHALSGRDATAESVRRSRMAKEMLLL